MDKPAFSHDATRLLANIITAYERYYEDQYEYGAEDAFLHRMEKLMADAGVIW